MFDNQNSNEQNNHSNSNNNNNLTNSNSSQMIPQTCNNITIYNNNNFIFIDIVLNNIENILGKIDLNDCEEFIVNIINIIPKLEDLINYYKTNNNNWRSIKKIILILSYDGIYRYNFNLDQYGHKLFEVAKKLFYNDCFEIKIESVKILAKIAKSKLIWDDSIKFIETEILISKNYYNRRLYLYFFAELIKNFSFKFLTEKGQIDELMKLINDNNQILSKFLQIIKFFIPLVIDDKIKYLIYNKLETLRKQIQNKEIIDKEVIDVNINKLLFNF